MSWYVLQLLTSSSNIRGSIYGSPSRISTEGEPIQELSLDSETYDDLLELEKRIKELAIKGILDEDEIETLSLLTEALPITAQAKKSGKSRITVSSNINVVAKKLATILGGKYTDEGYTSYLKNKYYLSEEEVLAVQTYITGNYGFNRGTNIEQIK